MWVSSSRIEKLERMIESLEAKLEEVKSATEMTIYDELGSVFRFGPEKRIPLSHAMQKIVSHFGLRFRLEKAHEAAVLEKNPHILEFGIPTTTPKKKGGKR